MLEQEETTKRVYELGFIIVPQTPEVEVPKEVDRLKVAITEVSGTILSEGLPEFIDLAYTMEKNIGSKKFKWSQGYFGFFKFDAMPESLEAIKKSLDANKELIRYIIVKTNVENAIVFKKPKVEAVRESESDGEVIIMDQDSTDDDEIIDDHEKLPTLDEDTAVEATEAKEA